MNLALYAIFFAVIAVIGWRLRQRKGHIGAAAVGSVYEMLNDEKRSAIEIIVEDTAAERDPERADDVVGRSGRMRIRSEQPADISAIRSLHTAAFEKSVEADLVDALRTAVEPFVSLVADDDGEIVGHILFSPVTLSGDSRAKIMGLAPMAVHPTKQRHGVGSALVEAGLGRCKELGYGAVVVLGHRTYYPRFGFQPSVRFGITSEYDVPDDVFMIKEIEPGYLEGKSGTIRYHSAFAGL